MQNNTLRSLINVDGIHLPHHGPSEHRLNNLIEQLELQLARAQHALDEILPGALARLDRALRQELVQYTTSCDGPPTAAPLFGDVRELSPAHSHALELDDRLKQAYIKENRRSIHDIVGVQRLAASRFRIILKQACPDLTIDLNFPSLDVGSRAHVHADKGLSCLAEFEDSLNERLAETEPGCAPSQTVMMEIFAPRIGQLLSEIEMAIYGELAMARLQISISSNMVGDCIDEAMKRHHPEVHAPG